MNASKDKSHAKKDCRDCGIVDIYERKGPKQSCGVYPNSHFDSAIDKTSPVGMTWIEDEEIEEE
jgi:hypothetical protein